VSLRRLSLVLAAVALIAGCSGSDEHYGREATLACLHESYDFELAKDEREIDLMAVGASNGAFEADLGFDLNSRRANTVTVMFARTEDQATRLLARNTFILRSHVGGPTDDMLYRESNAILFWESLPTGDEREAVEGCLRAG
jgi:hypothetical protein